MPNCYYFISNVDYFKRLIGECYKRKINLNAWLVSNGHAVAFRKYSKKYVSEEIFAKQEKKGMWQGKFQMPWKKAFQAPRYSWLFVGTSKSASTR